MIVAVKMIRGALPCGKALQRGAVDEKNIRPAIIVIIEDCNPSPGRLNDELLRILPAEDSHHRQAGLVRVVDELRQGRRLACRGGALCPCDMCQPADGEQPEQQGDLPSETSTPQKPCAQTHPLMKY